MRVQACFLLLQISPSGLESLGIGVGLPLENVLNISPKSMCFTTCSALTCSILTFSKSNEFSTLTFSWLTLPSLTLLT